MNVIQIDLPPLKGRGNDVQDLADLFMEKLSQQLAMPPVPIDAAVRASLAVYDWPGNVRELRNLIGRTLILGKFANPGDRDVTLAGTSEATLEEVERRNIMAVLAETGGNREEAARRLGISRKTLDPRNWRHCPRSFSSAPISNWCRRRTPPPRTALSKRAAWSSSRRAR
jgi:DNA-binding NtrC family response regulator